jgi:hypothetical protein
MTQLTIESLTMPVAAIRPPNPLPPLERRADLHTIVHVEGEIPQDMAERMAYGQVRSVLPYLLQDDYERTARPTGVPVAVLDNGLLRASFLLGYGGRLWSLTDLAGGRELLHQPQRIQPANLALRNAWFPGGVEWNIGTIGHTVHTCEPVHAARVVGPDGTPLLRLYEFERLRRTPWQVDAYLPDGSAALYLYVRIQNPTSETVPCYWWSNIAVPESPGHRVLAPALSAYHFSPSQSLHRERLPAPGGTDISYATNNLSSADYFFDVPDGRRPWIVALDGEGRGLFQVSTDRLRGRKLFVWGMHQGGRRWQEFLAGTGKPYMEIQAGIARTQLEHVPMPPRTAWSWVEAYGRMDADPTLVHGSWPQAVEATAGVLETIVESGRLDGIHRLLDRFAVRPPAAALHLGTGWGALERARRRLAGQEASSPGLPFPDESLDDADGRAWLSLLNEGRMADSAPAEPPLSYVVDPAWEPFIEQEPETWASALRLGVLRFAAGDEAGARNAWERSFELAPNAWAARNLACLDRSARDVARACERLSAAHALAADCVPLTLEWIDALMEAGVPHAALAAIDALEPRTRARGRVQLAEVRASVGAGEIDRARRILEAGFEVPDIREGDLTLERLWFDVQAALLSRDLDRPVDDDVRDLAMATRPIPRVFDFRMEPDART